MKNINGLVAFGLMFTAVAANADESALGKRLRAEDGWVGYHVAMVAGVGAPCCYSGGSGELQTSKCDLDARKGSFVSNDAGSSRSGDLSIYWHTSNGKLDQVKAFSADCAVTSRKEVRWIVAVDPKESVATTRDWIGSSGTRRDSMEFAALALQADPSATTALISLAAPQESSGMRKDAIFWLGHARGVDGANFVEKVATLDPSSEMREHAVFSLSQSDVKDAYERIRKISRQDSSAEVRSKALFWMAQMQDPRAAADIDAALTADASEEVREQAVFALSQLDDGKAAPALIAVVRGNHPRSIKEKALFWLGQSGAAEATAFLDEAVTK